MSSVHADKQIFCLRNALDKKVVVLHVRVDLVDWEVCQHICDLWGLVAGKTLNEAVDNVTNVLLVVVVLLNNLVQNWHCLCQIISVDAALGSHGHGNTSTSHWHGQAGSNGHGHVHGHVVGHGGTLVHSGLVRAFFGLADCLSDSCCGVGLCFHAVGDLRTAGEAGASVRLDFGHPGSFGGAFFRHFDLRSAGMAF